MLKVVVVALPVALEGTLTWALTFGVGSRSKATAIEKANQFLKRA
jgi:hypothetical protein